MDIVKVNNHVYCYNDILDTVKSRIQDIKQYIMDERDLYNENILANSYRYVKSLANRVILVKESSGDNLVYDLISNNELTWLLGGNK